MPACIPRDGRTFPLSPGAGPCSDVASPRKQEQTVDTATPTRQATPEQGSRTSLSWRDRRRVVIGALQESATDQVALAAAGCGFYATLALFPAISMLISVYGLVFDVVSVQQQLQVVRDLLPAPAFTLVDDRVRQLVSQPSNTLSIGFLVSLALTLWSAATGTKSVLSALNVAYEATGTGGMLRFQLIGLLMTICAVAAAALAIAVLVFLPTVISFLGLSDYGAALINALSMLFLVILVGGTIALLYRFGPARKPPPNQRIFPGAMLATALWLIASTGLSFYVSHIGSFGVTYGSLGAVVAIMLWFYISAYAVLLGAELNSQLEKMT
jgi:membrane protein